MKAGDTHLARLPLQNKQMPTMRGSTVYLTICGRWATDAAVKLTGRGYTTCKKCDEGQPSPLIDTFTR